MNMQEANERCGVAGLRGSKERPGGHVCRVYSRCVGDCEDCPFHLAAMGRGEILDKVPIER